LPEVICNTSPLQYLYQLGHLDLLPQLLGRVVVPRAVIDELAVGRAAGVALPDPTTLLWAVIQWPVSEKALPLITDLGPGESEVLMLGLERPDSVLVLDDRLARRVAESLGLQLTGTLGVLIDAKRAGLIPKVNPLLDQLQALRFRIAPHTRQAVLRLAGE
jgi:uncharacterized protein